MAKGNMLLKAAVAGIVGAAVVSTPSWAKESKAKKSDKNVKCYGVNKCGGHGQCGGPGHECAGKNSCKGQGWLYMPKESCENIEGGTLTPPEKKAAKTGAEPMKDLGSK
ncbi:MAG: DUF2282 domain-containing protein [Elusimicrobia bacterium]|nr:DUF2282 domain-containing protein [Elusimicrobiota bacterium]